MIVIDVRKLKDTVYDVASALVHEIAFHRYSPGFLNRLVCGGASTTRPDVGSPSMHATSRDR